MRFVLDATAIRSGVVISGQDDWYTTPSVLDELRRGKVAKDLDYLKEAFLKVSVPKENSIKKVQEVAEITGDISRLSETDIEVIALALELEAKILTDDYSIQNLARVLNIQYQTGVEKGIKEVFEWTYKCIGCARIYTEEEPSCPICGSELKQVRKK
jgi:UPF0271 protein